MEMVWGRGQGGDTCLGERIGAQLCVSKDVGASVNPRHVVYWWSHFRAWPPRRVEDSWVVTYLSLEGVFLFFPLYLADLLPCPCLLHKKQLGFSVIITCVHS